MIVYLVLYREDLHAPTRVYSVHESEHGAVEALKEVFKKYGLHGFINEKELRP